MSSPLNILVAEDNPDDVYLLKAAFKKAGVTSSLISVSDGVEAIAYLKGEEPYSDPSVHPFPDLMLLDLNMPRLNGFEVLEWIRRDERCRYLVVHILTASTRDLDVQRAFELHANSFIAKPTRLGDLVAFASALHNWHQWTRFAEIPARSLQTW